MLNLIGHQGNGCELGLSQEKRDTELSSKNIFSSSNAETALISFLTGPSKFTTSLQVYECFCHSAFSNFHLSYCFLNFMLFTSLVILIYISVIDNETVVRCLFKFLINILKDRNFFRIKFNILWDAY